MRSLPLLVTLVLLSLPMTMAMDLSPSPIKGTILEDPWEPDHDRSVIEAPWWERTANDLDSDGVNDVLDDLVDMYPVSDMRLNLILSFDGPIEESQFNWLRNREFDVVSHIEPIDALTIRQVPPYRIYELLGLEGTVFVDPIGEAVLFSDIATPTVRARESDMYSPETAWDLGYSGMGSSIAVIDTGIDDEHPSLKGKFLAGVDMTKPDNMGFLYPQDGTYNPDDIQGHGSTCSGIATGTGAPDGTYMGVAPGARLVDIRIGTKIGYAPGEFWVGALTDPQMKDGTLRGVQWGIDNLENSWPSGGGDYIGIDIMSISWGIDIGSDSDGTDPYSRLLDEAAERGAIVVNAAGNAGPDNTGFNGLSASSRAIVVAATDDDETLEHEDDFIAEYSSRGPRTDNNDGNPYDELKPDIAAPGTHIMNLQPSTARIVGDASNNGYANRGSGTSYSTPLVAGLIGLMLEANPDLKGENDLVKEILKYTAERKQEPTYPDLDPFWEVDFGYGVVDAYNSVRVSGMISADTSYDVDLQAHITGIDGNGSIMAYYSFNVSLPLVVSGLGWSRGENYERTEYRIDEGDWELVETQENRSFNPWSIRVSGLSEGDHRIQVRSISSSGDESIPSWIDITIIAGGAVGGGVGGTSVILPLLLFGLIAAAGVGFLVWKRSRKDRSTS